MVLLGWRPSELWSRNSTTCWPSGVASRMRAIGAKRLAFSARADKSSGDQREEISERQSVLSADVGAKRTAQRVRVGPPGRGLLW